MDAADLRVFESVARSGSMNRAAAALHTVQSNVTARIKELESEVGRPLFQRTSRGVTLTAAGRRLLPFATRAARLLEDASKAVRDDGVPSGGLTIGCLETAAAMRLSTVLTQFVASYPAVDLSLRTGTSCELIDQVLQGTVDGAFVCGPVCHPDLETETIFREELVILTTPTCLDVDVLMRKSDLRIVVLRAGCSYRLKLEAYLAQSGVVGVRTLEFGTLEAILTCVAAGIGITLLPTALIGSVCKSRRVRPHSLPGGMGAVETVFVRHREAYESSALRAFLDLARPSPSRIAAE
jgi:LysR family transcriptional regulator, cell division regulator